MEWYAITIKYTHILVRKNLAQVGKVEWEEPRSRLLHFLYIEVLTFVSLHIIGTKDPFLGSICSLSHYIVYHTYLLLPSMFVLAKCVGKHVPPDGTG